MVYWYGDVRKGLIEGIDVYICACMQVNGSGF